MIKFLRIRNLATIEDLELDFADGFSILTGETGAGKSIIIDSIRLILGEKGSSDLIRTGKSNASVESIFHFPESRSGLDVELDFGQENEVIIQRQISGSASGKSYISGVLVPVKRLKDIGSSLADIYGQNDHIFLLHLENHLNYLDSFIDALALRDEVAQAAQELRRSTREKKELESRQRERAQRLDFLEFQIKEIEAAGLKPEEEEELRSERNILKNAERIAVLVENALEISYLQDDSLSNLLARLKDTLDELSSFDRTFAETQETLGQFGIAIRELADFLAKFKERQDSSPERLEELESRLNLIERLKRKYGKDVTDILAFHESIKKEYRELSQTEEKLAGLEEKIEKCVELYREKTGKLYELRKTGARALEKQVEKEIALLGMKKAKFKIEIKHQPVEGDSLEKIRDSGTEEVEFLISPNPGEQLRPLRKIASGGELSRIMLAFKTIGKEKSLFKTLIFDEIDSGIGGKTAEFIAQKLRELAKRHQIICITHLPQIASFAKHHFRIEKKIEKDRTFTTVKKLDFEERVREIARLLSGTHITETSLQNAREMLDRNLQNGA